MKDGPQAKRCRTLACCVPRCRAYYVQAHHSETGGMGMKGPDSSCVPVCIAHHTELHTGGHLTFQEKYGIDLKAIAERLAEGMKP